MADKPPELPPEFQVHHAHKIDPIYQLGFSIAWMSVAVLFVLAGLPSFVHLVRTKRVQDAFFGIRKDTDLYDPVDGGRERTSSRKSPTIWTRYRVLYWIKSSTMWAVPLFGLDIGQLLLVLAYFITITLCSTLKAELIDNPNRPGSLAVAQLVPVFLLALKFSPLAVLLGTGYERLNFLHRWFSRGAILTAAVHGLLWLRNRYEYGLSITKKDRRGILVLGLMCVLGLSSLRLIRKRFYQLFLITHILSVPAFAGALRLHTKHSSSYLYSALVLWGLDLLFRLFRLRVRNANLMVPDTQMTIIRVHDCASGWSAGQHVRLRVFFSRGNHRVFESHPLTIMNAPGKTTCLGDIGVEHQLLLGARVGGDWSRKLNIYAHRSRKNLSGDVNGDLESSSPLNPDITFEVGDDEDGEIIGLSQISSRSKSTITKREAMLPSSLNWLTTDGGVSVRVILGGPYGGCPFDLVTFNHVLLIAGGSGVTFTLGLLDDLVGRWLKQEDGSGLQSCKAMRQVVFVWCVREFGAVRWIAPFLTTISERAKSSSDESTLDLQIVIYVTRFSNSFKAETEELLAPSIPNCDVVAERPRMHELVDNFASVSTRESDSQPKEGIDIENSEIKDETNLTSRFDRTSLAVCAAGPESLICDVKNAAVQVALRYPSLEYSSRNGQPV